jgi:mobilization protein NikA
MSYNPPHEPSPSSPGSHPAEDAAPPSKKRRSEKRQRESIIGVRVYDHERAKIEASAAAAGLCASSFLRALGTGQRRSSERRRPLPELKPFAQALGRLGIYASNAHQLLKLANRGELVYVEELAEASKKLDAAADELLKVIRG